MSYTAEDFRSKHEQRSLKIINLLERARLWYTEGIIKYGESPEYYGANADAFTKLIQDIKSGEYSIVLVGEFSSGKSTLLNALMRKRMLPSFKGETTATVNFLRHKERAVNGAGGVVYYVDGTSKDIPSADLQTVERYVSTRGENIAETVKHLDLFFDSEFLRDGVTLVDSPGLNGMAEGHREITEQQILNSHAAIFVFSSEKAGGAESEFRALKELKSKSGTILFVINKIDLITSNEGETLEDIIETYKSKYKTVFSGEEVPEFWALAANFALAARDCGSVEIYERTDFTDEERESFLSRSKIEAFEARLLEFLTKGEKTKAHLQEPVGRVMRFVKETRDEIIEEIGILNGKADTDAIKEDMIRIEEVSANLSKQIEQSSVSIKSETKDAFEEIADGQTAEIERFSKRFISRIDDCDSLDGISAYVSSLNAEVEKLVGRLENKISEELKNKVEQIVYRCYTQNAEELIEKFDTSENSALKLTVSANFSVDEAAFELGLDKMREEENRLHEELRKLEEQLNSAEISRIKARKIERERASIVEDIKNNKLKSETVRERMLPSVHERYVEGTRDKTLKERGLFGLLTGFLFGTSQVRETKLSIDTTERDEALRQREEDLERLHSEKDELEAKYVKLQTADANSEEAELQVKKYQRDLDRKSEEIIRMSESNRQHIQEKFKQQISTQKREIENYLDDFSSELVSNLRKVLKKHQNTYCEIIKDTIVGNIQKMLETEKEKLRLLQNKLNDSETEKAARIENLNKSVAEANSILEEAVLLNEELEMLSVGAREE